MEQFGPAAQRALLQQKQDFCRRTKSAQDLADTLLRQAHLEASEGDNLAAIALHEESAHLFERQGSIEDQASRLAAASQWSPAITLFQEAEATWEDVGCGPDARRVTSKIARCLDALGREDGVPPAPSVK